MNIFSGRQRDSVKECFARCLAIWDIAQIEVVERDLTDRMVRVSLDEFFLMTELHVMAVARKAALVAATMSENAQLLVAGADEGRSVHATLVQILRELRSLHDHQTAAFGDGLKVRAAT